MKFALITGASKGIGRALAIQLARRKENLILVARSEDLLRTLAESLQEEYAVAVRWKAMDLAAPGAAADLLAWCQQEKLQVHLLVNNAGFGVWGRFVDNDLDKIIAMNRLNVDALVAMTHLFLPELLRHPQSYLLNVGSMGGYMPLAFNANYGATKAYVVSFTLALREELVDQPINICALNPGGVTTEFTYRAGMEEVRNRTQKQHMSAEDCAIASLEGLFRNKAEIIPGFQNRLAVFLTRFLPRSLQARMTRRIFEPEALR